ncbi:MAG: pyrrolo-quinoline quinone, partial [Clostridiales bacterium]|nr:pyrrolo-quinoline quinone [Clostridiales bacterium]
ISDTEAYLYVGTSVHFTEQNGQGVAPFFKIDAMTGRIVDQYKLTCKTEVGVSGGIQATAALGRGKLDGLVFITYCRTPEKDSGVLVALDKATFELRWELGMPNYSWSSPCLVYQADGRGFVLQADSVGHIYLIDGATGEVLHKANIGASNFEASPAVFHDILVLGNRGQEIFGVKIS